MSSVDDTTNGQRAAAGTTARWNGRAGSALCWLGVHSWAATPTPHVYECRRHNCPATHGGHP